MDILKFLTFENTPHIVGTIAPWYEVLALNGIMFAISEFLDGNKLRRYVFRFSDLSKDVFQLLILSIISIVGAYLIAFMYPENIEPLPVICFPIYWEFFSLSSFTVALVIMLTFSIRPELFVPKINRSNCQKLCSKIHTTILYDDSAESLSAIATIVRANLKTVFSYASQFDRWWKTKGHAPTNPFPRIRKQDRHLAKTCLELLNYVLSEKTFCKHIATKDIGLTLDIINYANEYRIWRAGIDTFFRALFSELFMDSNSLLAKEMEFQGIGLNKPVFTKLFHSLELISWYRPHQTFPYRIDDKCSDSALKVYIESLEETLKNYFLEERSIFIADIPNDALSIALENLSEVAYFACTDISKITGDEAYSTKQASIINQVGGFFLRLSYL